MTQSGTGATTSLNPIDLSVFTGAVALPDAADRPRYEMPARGKPGIAAGVALPTTVEELRQIIRQAYAAGIRLLPQGANTGLVGASVPTTDGDTVVLSLDRLTGPVEINDGDATAVVAAGTRLSMLNDAARPFGLHLPVDLAPDPTIGGMIATNTGGSRVLHYGPMRAHVLGVEVVAADENATLFGGLADLRKDSRGVDIAHLVVGSGGTLGIVTRAVLALSPLPRRTETWWLSLSEPSQATPLFSALKAARPGTLTAFEFVSREALRCALTADGGPVNPFGDELPEGCVLAEWSSVDESSLDGLENDVADAFELGLLVDGVLVDAHSGWSLRHRVSDSVRTFGIVLGHDISTPRHALMAARAEGIEAIGAIVSEAIVCDFGHVGDGGLHLNVLFPHGTPAPTPASAAQIRGAVDTIVARYHGSYSAEHGLGPLNAERWLADTPLIEQRIVASIKAVVDPRSILGHPNHPYNRL